MCVFGGADRQTDRDRDRDREMRVVIWSVFCACDKQFCTKKIVFIKHLRISLFLFCKESFLFSKSQIAIW